MMRTPRLGLLLVPVLLLAVAPCAAVPAEPARGASASTGVPNAVQGFSQNQGKPIQIDAASLEVHDKDKVATFTGDVHVVQGDTDLRCKSLVVFYEDDAPKAHEKPGKAKTKTAAATPAAATASASPAMPTPGQQQIKRLEAKGGVIVTQKDQIATGDFGVYDFRTNLVTMTGNVVLTKGPDVIRGDRLVVDMKTGVSRVDTTHGQGVRAILNSGSMKDMKESTSAEPARPAAPRPVR